MEDDTWTGTAPTAISVRGHDGGHPHPAEGADTVVGGLTEAGVVATCPPGPSPDRPAEMLEGAHSAEGVLERARSRARFEAAQIRQKARADAEQTSEVLLAQARLQAEEQCDRIRAEAMTQASRMSELMLEESREDAFHEAVQLRDQAAAQVRQMIVDAERDAAALVDQALMEAQRARERAVSEADHIKAAMIDHTRRTAESDAVRLREEAVRDAEDLRARIVEEATMEAERIRVAGEKEKRALLEQAEDEAARLHLEAAVQLGRFSGEEAEGKLLRADEIGSRDFPDARGGFDRPSVRKWLELVQRSYAVLEHELLRARREWERALDVLEATRTSLPSAVPDVPSVQTFLDQQLRSARAEWVQSKDVLAPASPHNDDYDLTSLLVRACHLRSRLQKRPYGYSCAQVRELLDTLTIELALLRNQVGTLSAENEHMRGRLLATRPSPAEKGLTSAEPIQHLLPLRATAAPGRPCWNGFEPSPESNGNGSGMCAN